MAAKTPSGGTVGIRTARSGDNAATPNDGTKLAAGNSRTIDESAPPRDGALRADLREPAQYKNENLEVELTAFDHLSRNPAPVPSRGPPPMRTNCRTLLVAR